MTRVLVCGGRHYDDPVAVYGALGELWEAGEQLVVIHGGARGADTFAARWCQVVGVAAEELVFRAEWDRYGKAAGAIRNQQMLIEGKPDLVLAFPGGRGTADMVRRARQAGIEVRRPATDA